MVSQHDVSSDSRAALHLSPPFFRYLIRGPVAAEDDEDSGCSTASQISQSELGALRHDTG